MDNGGAIAIKGFNFQKACIILVVLDNYLKEDFYITVEAEDDFVVKYKDYQAFIQVKGQNTSINKIKKIKEGTSIIQKNISSGDSTDTHKIFVLNFSNSDIKHMVRTEPGNICDKIYSFNNVQLKELISHLSYAKLPDLDERLKNTYIYIASFAKSLDDAILYLLGKLNHYDISIDNQRGRGIIAELALIIDQKSEKKIINPSDKEFKKIQSDYFKELLTKSQKLSEFQEILKGLDYSIIFKKKIELKRTKIAILFISIKKEIKSEIKKIKNYEELPEATIIDHILSIYSSKYEKSLLIAIIIESLIEIGDEIIDCSGIYNS
ncbi:hypothetical protein ASG65_17725 [Bacillus sp. Leaf13]|nr:hypothetical protein ASG65_17725 [Bacillus sp. Leaf13]